MAGTPNGGAEENPIPAEDIPLVSREGDRDGPPEEGWALCLSGGGYRAMLFHLGVLWRLNELGFLPKLDRISSVSGGSITAGVLGLHWSALQFNNQGVASNFGDKVVAPVRKLAGETIDADSIVVGLLTPGSIGDKVAKAYEKHTYGKKTLQDLPDRPRFVINATNVQTGALFRFSKPYLGDHQIGRILNPAFPLSRAVAASSAFPPALSPLTIKFNAADFKPDQGSTLSKSPYTTKVVLSDGGVYDNMGIETAWKRYTGILVSDGGGKMQPEKDPHSDWVRHSSRINSIIDNQVRSLRKRQVIAAFRAKSKELHRDGAYWGIRTDITKYGLADALPAPHQKTLALADTPTRLAALKDNLQKKLINWGYAVCDAAMRKHVAKTVASAPKFPYPNLGVG